MASEWIDCQLADSCAAIDYGLTASASQKKVGPKFLRITDIVSGHINWNDVPNVDVPSDDIEKYRLKHGDLVLARTGASTGASAFVQDPPEAVFASYLVRLRPKPEFDARFISYYLRSSGFWQFIKGVLGDKSAQPNASASTMTRAPFRAPRRLSQQQRIADILGTLDDKIELNRRMSETLEAMARALFKSWFVHFDPVRAKAEGRDAGMPTHIAELFPESFEQSELGEIPKGWIVKQISQLASIEGGSTPNTTQREFWNGTRAFATPKDLSALKTPVLLKTERRVSDLGLAQISSSLLAPGTVLLSSRAPIGYLAIAEIPVAINQGFIAMKPREGTSNLFLLRWAEASHDDILSRANGSTFLEISKSAFRPIQVVTPTAAVMRCFDMLSQFNHSRLVSLEQQSALLEEILNTLLPKLISGEIRIEAAERAVAGV